MDNKNWNFNEFLAFLLIYASHVDFDFSDEEKDEIEKIVGSKEIFEDIFAHFNTLTDYQALELILSYRDIYYSTVAEKEVLFKQMHKLFLADGDFSTLEKELLMFLKKMM